MNALQVKAAISQQEAEEVQQRIEEQQQQMQEELAALLGPILLAAMGIGFTAAVAGLTLPGLTFPADKASKVVESYKEKLARQIMDTTKKEIAAVLQTAQKEGWPVTKLRDEVRAVFNRAAEERAEKIGLTEAVRLTNFGAMLAYAEAGFEYKRWVAYDDNKVCPFCKAMDGKIVAMGEPFARIGDTIRAVDDNGKEVEMTVVYFDQIVPNLHPRCRCILVPANKPATDA